MTIFLGLFWGLIAYWFYWSIKRKGVYWLLKVFLFVVSFLLLFISLVTYQLELNRLLDFFYGNVFIVRAMFFIWYLICAHFIQKHFMVPIVFALDKKIKKGRRDLNHIFYRN